MPTFMWFGTYRLQFNERTGQQLVKACRMTQAMRSNRFNTGTSSNVSAR